MAEAENFEEDLFADLYDLNSHLNPVAFYPLPVAVDCCERSTDDGYAAMTTMTLRKQRLQHHPAPPKRQLHQLKSLRRQK